jgi:hypothetical protein
MLNISIGTRVTRGSTLFAASKSSLFYVCFIHMICSRTPSLGPYSLAHTILGSLLQRLLSTLFHHSNYLLLRHIISKSKINVNKSAIFDFEIFPLIEEISLFLDRDLNILRSTLL